MDSGEDRPFGAACGDGRAASGRGLATGAKMLVFEVKPAEAAFPGKNGKRAYEGSDGVIYTIRPGGGGKTEVTEGEQPPFSADGKKIAYTHYSDEDLADETAAIYKIAAGGGREVLVTDNNGTGGLDPSWGSRL